MGNDNIDRMNASSNGAPVLNNSSVPSAPLLSQVSNLANLPNRSGGANTPDMMQQLHSGSQQGGPDTSKMSRKLMEAMKRTASSRKLIRDLNIAAMLRGDLKTSSSSKLSMVKAKRKSGRQGYTKSRTEAAVSRQHARHKKAQQQKASS